MCHGVERRRKNGRVEDRVMQVCQTLEKRSTSFALNISFATATALTTICDDEVAPFPSFAIYVLPLDQWQCELN